MNLLFRTVRRACGRAWLIVALIAATSGCGRSGGLETAPVRGKVTLDGQPFTSGGSVVFQPQGRGKMATGQVEADGTFTLSTYASGDGATIGKHNVMVRPPVARVVNENEDPKPVTSPIPKKYMSLTTSGLEVDVKAGQTNEIPIDLRK